MSLIPLNSRFIDQFSVSQRKDLEKQLDINNGRFGCVEKK